MALILASQSPRRRELLSLLTTDFTVSATALDESVYSASSPALLAETLAFEKASAVFSTFGDTPVLACDTLIDLDGQTLGKPANRQEALQMLSSLSGRSHQVHTGVCLMQNARPVCCFTETTLVFFDSIPKSALLAVVDTDEPYDKAGAYGIQGWAARFIPRIEGCYYNVMGLPLAALQKLLSQEGLL